MATSIKVFGATVFAVRFPSILFASVGGWLVYLMGRRLFTQRAGLLAAGLFSVHGLTNLLTTGKVATDHVDVYFMFFCLLGGYAAVRAKGAVRSCWPLILLGFAIGCAVLVKWLPAYTLLLAYAALHYRCVPLPRLLLRCAYVLAVSLAVWVPWQVYAALSFPEVFVAAQHHNYLHLTTQLENHTNGPLYLLSKSIYLYGEVFVVGLAYVGWRTWKTGKAELLFLITWIGVPLVFFSLVATKMQAYTYFTAPAIFLLSALTIGAAWDAKILRAYGLRIVVVGGLLISPAVRYFESLQLDSIPTRQAHAPTTFDGDTDPSTVIIFGSKQPFNDMFFLNVRAAYAEVPPDTVIEALREDYHVISPPPPANRPPTIWQ